ncbi:MAG: hypothetical protein CVV30_11380 [Methanomicrobiales archaeon HGW-Methanomicrobiales-1]|jgi:hypothetical protein|nr:MAG: hypothetical protein CVV30_11380 [Methanomicrobiales archaeon HGW-Methanomicrobiales-1]
MAIEITDSDITYAENLLLPPGHSFNKERRDFIRCMSSHDVVACPGSGKTTALLAKLIILARKMPFDGGRGICVLTHTNVAIDLIKQRAGKEADSLFQYPNFFGTIQTFVNQFLTIPYFRSKFRKPIVSIDDERFYAELKKICSVDRNLLIWMEHKHISSLGEFWFNPETLDLGKNLDDPIPNLSKETAQYKKIHGIRMNLLEKGILSYNDAYSVALNYIHSNPALFQAFRGRFNLIFLDESQDTDVHQLRVLDSIFPPASFIVQRIGDPNQAIFNSKVGNESFWTPRAPLYFSDSYRYGESIKKILTAVRVYDHVCLQPCQTIESYPPQLICFNEGEEQQVIYAFKYLIEKYGIQEKPFYAVGWIGKNRTGEAKLCIPSYYPTYDQIQKKSTIIFHNLISYSAYAIKISSSESVKRFYDIILQSIAQSLNTAGIKTEEHLQIYTPRSVERFWNQHDERSFKDFRNNIAIHYRSAIHAHISPTDLCSFIKSVILHIWPLENSSAQFFLTDAHIDPIVQSDVKKPANQIIFEDGVVIHVGTVHSVKGETHASTLYLETNYQSKNDSERLIEFLKGNRPKKYLDKPHHIQNLLMAHVAFSRPQQLLAFACQASNISGHEADLMKNGWEISSVSDLIKK